MAHGEETTGLPLPGPKTSRKERPQQQVTEIADTINNLNGNMGITGIGKQLMNLTAMVVIAAIACVLLYFFLDQFKAQAASFEANLKELRRERQDDREAIQELTRSVRILVNEFRKARGAPPIEFEPMGADAKTTKPPGG